jgi:20S proteasome alpha/beta subunit
MAQISISPFTRTSVAVAGKDFCVIAADTRQSTGYSINSRTSPKAYVLSDTSVIAMNGFHADGLTLKKVLEQRMKVRRPAHTHTHTHRLARLLTFMLLIVVQVCSRQEHVL